MEQREMKKLIAAQQTELDAVLLYQGLAKLMKTEEEKQVLLGIAADEGRHAGILKQITGADLKPKKTLAKATAVMYKIGGKRLLFPFMAKFETNSYFTYQPFFETYPQIADIASDETRHGHLLTEMIK